MYQAAISDEPLPKQHEQTGIGSEMQAKLGYKGASLRHARKLRDEWLTTFIDSGKSSCEYFHKRRRKSSHVIYLNDAQETKAEAEIQGQSACW